MSRGDKQLAPPSRRPGRPGAVSPAWAVAALLLGLALPVASRAQPLAPGATPLRPAGPGSLGDPPMVEGLPSKGGCDDTRIQALLDELRAEITGPTTAEVRIDCSLQLKPNDVIQKRMVFRGRASSGVTVEGNGALIDGGRGTFHFGSRRAEAMVEIVSEDETDPTTGATRSTRPVNVTLRNLRIRGSVKIAGNLQLPSTDPHYVERVRDNAPRNITFDHLTITSLGLPCGEGSTNCTALYVHGGVGALQVVNSTIEGGVPDGAVAVYLDDTSYGNTFRNNTISVRTGDRESMALDGSSDNHIAGNRFSNYAQGALRLYLNCGEGGWMRRGTPSRNVIVDNVFEHPSLLSAVPVHVASRNGKGTSTYTCPPMSFDDARFNAVMLNRIVIASPLPSIPNVVEMQLPVGRPDVNGPNFIKDNEIAFRAMARPAGCFVSDGYPDLLRDSQFTEVFHASDGGPICRGFRLTCRDGVLVRSNDNTCPSSALQTVPFDCRAAGNNDGCRSTVSIPAGKTIIGASALCNLENDSVSEELGEMRPNAVRVLRASDQVSDGSCTLGDTVVREHQASVSLFRLNEMARATGRVSFGCREKDANGGDCQIRGLLHLR